jgi:hypothetical protein
MTRISKASSLHSYKSKLMYVGVHENGQEITFEWEVQGHPTIMTFTKKFNLGSELYGQKNFEQLQKHIKWMTGREIDDNSDLQEQELQGMIANLTFGTYSGHIYIASIEPIKQDQKSTYPVVAPKDFKTDPSVSMDPNDEVPF